MNISPNLREVFKVVNYESAAVTVNDYIGTMKSDDANAALRKLVESALQLRPSAVPQEHFGENFAFLVLAPRDGWAVGFRIDFTSESWGIAEIVSMPVGKQQRLPSVDPRETQEYIEAAVERARGRSKAMADQLASLSRNSDFIEDRFESWRDKSAPRTNVEYAALAAKYADEVRAGNSRATATLAGRVGMAPAVMAQRVKEARRRLLLTKGEKGRASGVLTPLGVLYADPAFPGMRVLRREGLRQRDIGDKYGIAERLVWAGIEAERPEGGISISMEEFMPKADKET